MFEFKELVIRKIEQKDNEAIAKIIRDCLIEFKANKPGTVFFDPTTDDLFTLFKKENSIYFVVEKEGQLVGGAGLFPTPALPEKTVELVKIYLIPAVRKIGLGKFLIELLIHQSQKMDYQYIYLESMPELISAVYLYKKMGFENLQRPLGNSGHCGCNIWMKKNIS